jgi:hypothetical protein
MNTILRLSRDVCPYISGVSHPVEYKPEGVMGLLEELQSTFMIEIVSYGKGVLSDS